MCQVLKVSISGYYYWLKHPVGLRAGKEQQLLACVKKIYQQSECRYGSPRIAGELQQQGIQASRPRVTRLMRKHAIQSVIRRINCCNSKTIILRSSYFVPLPA
jgi:putative transposase